MPIPRVDCWCVCFDGEKHNHLVRKLATWRNFEGLSCCFVPPCPGEILACEQVIVGHVQLLACVIFLCPKWW